VLNARGAATTVSSRAQANRLRSFSSATRARRDGPARADPPVVPIPPVSRWAGLLDEDEAVQHDQRHALFNVGAAGHARRGRATRLAVHDTVLLASDGLFGNLFIDEIIDTDLQRPVGRRGRPAFVARARADER
jgi:hypothetical protein